VYFAKEQTIRMKKFPHIRNGKINCINCLYCKITQENGDGRALLLNLFCKRGYWENEEEGIQVDPEVGMTDELEVTLKEHAEGCLEFEPMDE